MVLLHELIPGAGLLPYSLEQPSLAVDGYLRTLVLQRVPSWPLVVWVIADALPLHGVYGRGLAE
jgi:hypothetical protein